MPPPDKVKLYRMVHWQNVHHILQYGLCCREHTNADPNYINIGLPQLIDVRHNYTVPINESGSLGEYIPFYFSGHSPMLYLIKNGYKEVVKRPQEDIVYLILSFANVKKHQLEFVFTDRNARIATANFYNNEKDFDQLDWEIIKSKIWEDTEDNRQRKDLKQAEFLIRDYIPVSCIESLVVKTEERKEFFTKMINNFALPIEVYFDKTCKLYY